MIEGKLRMDLSSIHWSLPLRIGTGELGGSQCLSWRLVCPMALIKQIVIMFSLAVY